MIIFGPLLVIVAICFICWLLFNLAVFALLFFVGLTVGVWAFHTGAGVFGGILVGLVAWQTIFAVIGAVAVGITAFLRFTGMAAPGPAGQRMART